MVLEVCGWRSSSPSLGVCYLLFRSLRSFQVINLLLAVRSSWFMCWVSEERRGDSSCIARFCKIIKMLGIIKEKNYSLGPTSKGTSLACLKRCNVSCMRCNLASSSSEVGGKQLQKCFNNSDSDRYKWRSSRWKSLGTSSIKEKCYEWGENDSSKTYDPLIAPGSRAS